MPAAAACGAPHSATPPAAIAQIVANTASTCARLVDGSVWCWGARGITRIDNDVLGSLACPVATRIAELSRATDILGACITRDDGSIVCGDLASWRFDAPKPFDARRLFMWSDDRCAITNAGTIRCEDEAHASDAAVFTNVDEVAFLGHDICALSIGMATCLIDRKPVVLGSKIASITDGERWLWATRSDGSVLNLQMCGTKPCEYTQNLIDGAAARVERAGPHTCIVSRAGRVWCERRCAVTGCKENGFVEVTGVSGATQIATSADHACVVTNDGSVVCWGESHCGQSGGPVESGKPCSGKTPVPPTAIQWAKQ